MIRIDEEFKSLIPPMTADEYAGLEKSIKAEGCRDSLVVWNGTLVDGHNRYEICSRYGMPFNTVAMNFDSRDAAMTWIIKNQFSRRNILTATRCMLAGRLEEIVARQNKEKQIQAGKENGIQKGQKQNEKVTQPVGEAILEKLEKNTHENETADIVAKSAGISRETYRQFKQVQEKAPEPVKQAVMSGETSIKEAYKQVKREEKERNREETRQQNAEKVSQLQSPLDAQGLFQTIVIDPPWDWGDEGDCDQFGRAKPDYTTMSIDEIENLPISKIADENCHLYLWITNRSLPKGFKLIEAWGFRYVTCLTWVKPNFGMGNYFRGSTEQVLFAVKGHQQLKRHDCPTHFTAPRGNGHSAKPDEFYDIVESCSYGPYIDVFGRKERHGWSVWGENA